MPRQKSVRSAPRALAAPRRSPRLGHAAGGQAPHTTQQPTPAPPDNVATSSDESESDDSDDQRPATLVPRGRQQKQPKRTTTTTTTTQRAGATHRRRTMRIEVPEGVNLADALASPAQPPAIADKLMELVTRMEANAERNELARVEERRDAQRLYRETVESNARQAQLVVTAFREAMATSGQTFHDAIDAITRQNEGLASALRELQACARDET